MAYGLFGKLPQKRDFLSINLPHTILHPFENWLQSAVAASRNEIGRNWENFFLVAPIWRFWLGREILGTACTGSIMPSVDQVGRYFPLAIIYWAEDGETLTPPLLNPLDSWYQRIEERMLAVLSDDAPADVAQLLHGLMPPDYSAPPPPPLSPRPAEPVPAAMPPPPSVSAPVTPEPEPEPVAVEAEAPEPADAMADSAEEVAEASAGADEEVDAPGAEEPQPEEAPSSEADLWMPEPMAAERVAELQKISASSLAPHAPEPIVPKSPWDAPARPEPTEKQPATSVSSNLWGDDEADTLAPVAVAEPDAPASDDASLAVLSGAPLSAAPAPDVPEEEPEDAEPPAPPPATAPQEGASPIAAESPAPSPPAAPGPSAPEVDISSSDFKGGVFAVIEGDAGFAEALPQLLALDVANASQGRSYWWCGPSSSGGPRLFAKSGLPDPYLFTRMLMYTGQ